MKVFVGLVSSNERLCSEYGSRRSGMLPRSSLPASLQNGTSFKTAAFNPLVDERSPEEFLDYGMHGVDAAMLLLEASHAHLFEAVRSSCFAVVFNVPGAVGNFQNFLGQKLSRPLRNFSFLLEAISDSDSEQVAILPLRNFIGNDLQELARVCREDTQLPSFGRSITENIALLKDRKRPRRKSSYCTLYVIDDKKKHFQYGKEHHAQLGTGAPHRAACKINGNFRFGKRIDARRHFNVSYGDGDKTTISGQFPNCHDYQQTAEPGTHLNMFSNDFF